MLLETAVPGATIFGSEFLGTLIYAEVSGTQRNLGYAAALSMILLVVAVSVSVFIQLRGRERTRPDKPAAPQHTQEDTRV